MFFLFFITNNSFELKVELFENQFRSNCILSGPASFVHKDFSIITKDLYSGDSACLDFFCFASFFKFGEVMREILVVDFYCISSEDGFIA